MKLQKFYIISLFLFAIFLVSCSSKEEQDVRKVYKDIVQAVLSDNTSVLSSLAPFLIEDNNLEALKRLKEIFRSKPSYSVVIINSNQAIIQLSDSSRTVLPFALDGAGKWVMVDTLQHIQHIDFIPAANN